MSDSGARPGGTISALDGLAAAVLDDRGVVVGWTVRRERVWGVSGTPPNTLQYRFDGPEDAPVLILGPSLGTTYHRL